MKRRAYFLVELLVMIAFIGVLLVLIAGCGPPHPETPYFPVRGIVTLDGEPLESGMVSFQSPDDARMGIPSGSGPIVDGTYELLAPVGEKTVQIWSSIATGPADATGAVPTKETIAEKYNRNSGLRATVSDSESNVFDFNIESEASPP